MSVKRSKKDDPPTEPAPPTPPLTLMGLPDDVLRKIVNKMDMETKFEASQVCHDFRRLLVTDAEPGSFGPLNIAFTEHVHHRVDWDWRGGTAFLSLNPEDLGQHLWPLIRLLGLNRSHLFSKIEISVHDTIGNPPASAAARLHMVALSSVLVWLQSDNYSGELVLDSIRLAESHLVNEFSNIAQQLWTPTRVGLIDLRCPGLRSNAVGSLRTLERLSQAKNITGFSRLELPAIPAFSFSNALSSLAPISSLEIGPRWEDWMETPPPDNPLDTQGIPLSLTQISGLTNISSLTWFPNLDSHEQLAQVLPSFSNLVDLQLRQTPVGSWNQALSTVLTALDKLTSVSLTVWEDIMEADFADEIPGSQLSTLAPLSLPPSIVTLELGFSPFRIRKSLQVDLFANMDVCHSLESIYLATFGDAEPNQKDVPGSESFWLTIGASLHRIPSLASLIVNATGSWQEQTAVYFPRELSCMTFLTRLETGGSCGIHKIEVMPRSWVAAGFRDVGELNVSMFLRFKLFCSSAAHFTLQSVQSSCFFDVIKILTPYAYVVLSAATGPLYRSSSSAAVGGACIIAFLSTATMLL